MPRFIQKQAPQSQRRAEQQWVATDKEEQASAHYHAVDKHNCDVLDDIDAVLETQSDDQEVTIASIIPRALGELVLAA
jgi:hypothetical protein